MFDLEERLIDFAVRIIRPAESLPKAKVGNHVSGQLIGCGTSPAPNYSEAQGTESRSDFIHKMKVSLKRKKKLHDSILPFSFWGSLFCCSIFDIHHSKDSAVCPPAWFTFRPE